MQNIIDVISSVNDKVNGIVWGVPAIVLILGCGILYTIITKFFQVRKFGFMFSKTIGQVKSNVDVRKSSDEKTISQLQALFTTLAGTIGTGNIAGVATALVVGGPGAVFWMWVSAFFGMMTHFGEVVLGIYYRRKNPDGSFAGGAMYYLKYGVGSKKNLKNFGAVLGILFALFTLIATFGIGNMTQVNSIADALNTNFGISPMLTGIVIAFFVGIIIIGGITRIASVTEKLVPFMAVFYIFFTVSIFILNYKQIPYVFTSIFADAFNTKAIAGGAGGYILMRAIQMGFKRGIFSNEAGLGSSVMAHCASNATEPVEQGLWGIFEVFFDTIVVCTLTAFVVLSSTIKVPTLNTALKNLSSTNNIVSIMENGADDLEVPLLDSDYNFLSIKTNSSGIAKVYETSSGLNEYTEAIINGKTYYVETKNKEEASESDFIYANVVNIRANGKLDNNGNPIVDERGASVIDSITINQINGASLVSLAFSSRFGGAAGRILAVAVILFAFSTVLGWAYYGSTSIEYLLGPKSSLFYKIVYTFVTIIGATMNLSLAWGLSDTFNGLMAIPNLIGILILAPVAVQITKNYFDRQNGLKVKAMVSFQEEEKTAHKTETKHETKSSVKTAKKETKKQSKPKK